MAKIKIKASKDAVEKAGESGDFEQPKPGLYVAELVQCDPGHAKGDDGKPDKNRPYLECVYKITGVGREGAKPESPLARLWDYVSFTPTSEWKVAQFALAMGIPLKNGAIDGTIENEANKPGTVIGTKVLARVKADKDLEGNYRGKIGNVTHIDSGTKSETADAFDDSDGDAEEASPFDDSDEGETSTEEEDDLLTEEDLANMDNKELAEVAKEFDIEPKEFIKVVKGKKQAQRAELIAAILEAQGGDEEGEDGDDEDPF